MTLAVIVDAFRPKVNPFPFPKVKAERLFEVVPALTLMPEIRPFVVTGAATETEIPLEAMVPEAFVPAKAALAWTKSEPRFEAMAVVR